MDTPNITPRRLTPDEIRAAVADIRAAVQALPQPRRTLGEQLEADRQSRERALTGDDVSRHTADHG